MYGEIISDDEKEAIQEGLLLKHPWAGNYPSQDSPL